MSQLEHIPTQTMLPCIIGMLLKLAPCVVRTVWRQIDPQWHCDRILDDAEEWVINLAKPLGVEFGGTCAKLHVAGRDIITLGHPIRLTREARGLRICYHNMLPGKCSFCLKIRATIPPSSALATESAKLAYSIGWDTVVSGNRISLHSASKWMEQVRRLFLMRQAFNSLRSEAGTSFGHCDYTFCYDPSPNRFHITISIWMSKADPRCDICYGVTWEDQCESQSFWSGLVSNGPPRFRSGKMYYNSLQDLLNCLERCGERFGKNSPNPMGRDFNFLDQEESF